MRKFTVEGKPQRLGKYLGMVFPELGFAYFRQLLKTKNVRINERRRLRRKGRRYRIVFRRRTHS